MEWQIFLLFPHGMCASMRPQTQKDTGLCTGCKTVILLLVSAVEAFFCDDALYKLTFTFTLPEVHVQ